MWDFCHLSWSPLLYGTSVASVGHLRYMRPPLSLQLVASTPWDHLCRFSWSPPLHGTFIALVGRLHSLLLQLVAFTLVASVGRLRFTWGLFLLLRRLCYVHLFQTGLAQGHAPVLLPDRSSSRARTYTDSIAAMRWKASDSIFLRFRSPMRPIAEGLGLSVRKPISSILSIVVLWKHYHCRRW